MKLTATVICLGLLAGCRQGQGTAGAPSLSLAPCRVEGVSAEVRCGTHEVLEDRSKPHGRKISLRVAMLPALAQTPEPDPLFILAGGPGQAATEVMKVVQPMMERIRRRRDLVFVDQRGTGASSPLDCEEKTPEADLGTQLSRGMDVTLFEGCLKGYAADVKQYTTTVAMDDLDEVREALGYSRVNLWGASYGTRAAMVFMRQHPDRVRSAVLDGVYPLDIRLPLTFARDGQRALELLFEHCEKEPACHVAFPKLRERFAELSAKLQAGPQRFQVAHPVTGKREDVTLSHQGFVSTLRGLLYLPETASLLPLTLERAVAGDWGPFVAQADRLSSGFSKGMSLGMFFSVICSEDTVGLAETELVDATRDTFLGDGLARDILRVCAVWPKAALPPGYRQPLKSDIPTLLLSGELDPVTPPARAESVKAGLARSAHVVVPGVGHGATGQGCVPKLVAELIERGSIDGIEGSCTQKLGRPPFFVTFAGPPP
ncbi:MAG: alpha/beta hydrolase [Myxococcaceae bacterium]